mmetsp:Transcript_21505/g.36995  ORF Transcript_21505/g.36995 Transcript_21505/m.36995 type:complete len:82 (-) Transcript_21505:81-326(-)
MDTNIPSTSNQTSGVIVSKTNTKEFTEPQRRSKRDTLRSTRRKIVHYRRTKKAILAAMNGEDDESRYSYDLLDEMISKYDD